MRPIMGVSTIKQFENEYGFTFKVFLNYTWINLKIDSNRTQVKGITSFWWDEIL